MEINFENYKRVNSVYEGQAIERIDIPSDIVINEILEKYKDIHGIDRGCQIVKLSDYIQDVSGKSNNWKYQDYHNPDIDKLKKVNVEYAYIEEWEESTPHGSFTRISYGGEATERDWKVQKALTTIKGILNSV